MNTNTQREQSILEKALDINLKPEIYGSFAEIGAGQEVARHFFLAGKASQTIALTISAYDMTFSDAIYGKEKSGRYVCQSRLQKMLDKEYDKLIERLDEQRGEKSQFFAFADTVATSSQDKAKFSHGWIGLKFQTHPQSEPSQITLHVRLLDSERLRQQETLGKLGVNLVHCCYFKRNSIDLFLSSLFEHIKVGALSVDAIYTQGKAFEHMNNLEINLKLIELDRNEGLFIDAHKNILTPSEAFWNKSLFIQRGFYKPVTNTHLDIASRGEKHFKKEFQLKDSDHLTVFEFTLNNKFKNEQIPTQEALTKIHMITDLGLPCLVTKFSYFYQLKEYIRQSTQKPLGIVIGATHLEKLFKPDFYADLKGGLLEGMGKLLDTQTRLYIYPHKTAEICLLTKSFFPEPQVAKIYQHFIENKCIQDIAGCEDITEFIHSDDIKSMIQTKNTNWKKHVPEKIQLLVEKWMN